MFAVEYMQPALKSLLTAMKLYGRSFVRLTVLSAVPALVRVVLFLDVPWISDVMAGVLELLVVGFRLAILFVAFRVVWPQDATRPAAPARAGAMHRLSWPAAVWQVLVLIVAVLLLNLAADGLAGLIADETQVRTAFSYALKNLFIIPFWLVHLLVALRTTVQGT